MAVNFTRQSPTWVNDTTGGANPPPEAVVLAEDAERWEQLGADVAAWSAAIPAADLAAGPGLRIERRPGRFYPPTIFYTSDDNSGVLGSGTCYFLPFAVSQRENYDAFAILVSAPGAAGSVIRMGMYRSNGNATPSTLVVDGGTVGADSTGDKVITVTPFALDPGFYWIALLSNGGSGLRVPKVWGTLPGTMFYGSHASDASVMRAILTSTGYDATAALPATATITSEGGQRVDCPICFIRRSA